MVDVSDYLARAAGEELRKMSEAWSTATASRSWYMTKLAAAFVRQSREHLSRFGYESYYPQTWRNRAIGKSKLSKSQRKAAHLFKQPKREPLFGGYLFVRVDIEMDHWHGVFRDAGIYGIACAGDLPYPATAIVELLKRREEADGVIPGVMTVADLFEPGEIVRVAEGAFQGFNGTIETVDPDGLITVLLRLFGRECRATLEFTDCEKV